MKTVVVVGSGLAAYSAIRELRKLNREIPITLVTNDSGDYYSKPMLSNAYAQGKNAENLVLTRVQEMAQQLDFTALVNTEVQAIDATQHLLSTSGGVLEYAKLVLALGAEPIRIPVQGDAAQAVCSVNNLGDYAKFRTALNTTKSIAIMGGGLIGCEFANDLASAGYQVTVIDPAAYPLASLLPELAGNQLLEPLQKLAVSWRFGVSVQAVNQSAKGYALTLSDASTLNAEVVLSAVGLRPRIALAREAGLAVNRGITVDDQLRSSDADIYALGDCAEMMGWVLPYVLPIMHAARVLARVLNQEAARLVLPAMPVVVKTPAHPIVVSPVARDALGEWQIVASGQGVKMEFSNPRQQPIGFVLTGEYASQRNEMTKRLFVPT